MTYLQFHLVFIVPPLTVLLGTLRGVRERLGPRAQWVLPMLALIALVYTTLWDNYLVHRGVWTYGPDRVLGTIGYVPVEDYLFFLLQPLLTGAWTYHVLFRSRVPEPMPPAQRRPTSLLDQFAGVAPAGAVAYLLCAAGGLFALTIERSLYLGLILVWAAPVLALQWLFIAAAVSASRRAFLLAVGAPTLYLWLIDAIAIRSGIWTLAQQYTVGIDLLGLPLEEAVFFLVTNLLVVQGALLFLQPAAVSRGALAAAAA